MKHLLLATTLLGVVSATAGAAEKPTYALFRLDPLGIEPEIVEQLERILRVELERALGQTLPARAEVERVAASNKKLAGCTGDPSCLSPLAKLLKATRVVTGNVGGLADSYVVNLKLVETDGRELRRVTVTLHGSPEELIDEIRIAAIRLVTPEKLVGNIAVLSDVPDATVNLDGNNVGLTPLAGALAGLSVGVHKLSVTREGFSPFAEEVPVRFEKTTQVVVRQSATTARARRAMRAAGEKPIYTRWWFWGAMAVSAVATGLALGYGIPKQTAVDCAAKGAMCP
jgi:hypothetical protein